MSEETEYELDDVKMDDVVESLEEMGFDYRDETDEHTSLRYELDDETHIIVHLDEDSVTYSFLTEYDAFVDEGLGRVVEEGDPVPLDLDEQYGEDTFEYDGPEYWLSGRDGWDEDATLPL